MSTSRSSSREAIHDEDAAAQTYDPRSAEADESRNHRFKLRSYQLEMLEESMQRNIIIAVRNSKLCQVREAEYIYVDGYWLRQNLHVRTEMNMMIVFCLTFGESGVAD